ncbi:hypothetical protein A0U94_02830 [Gluconobacter albidus]|uniref:hypothetical protein n=1 Tax=Gluconobacter albidus TaxID=318683 RepID=UPI00098AEB84|nr:hypothetical protein [Gluconobacter albidus]AQS90072.1 hypothetical protein A0U94_02830 [Gluconobacter albidus]
MAGAVLGSCNSVHAQAADIHDCVTAATVVPLLEGRGDAPVIPVTVGTLDAAMFVSFDAPETTVWNTTALNFSPTGRPRVLTEDDGTSTFVYNTALEDLRVGNAAPVTLPAELMPPMTEESVNGRPLIGMLGVDVISKGPVILDEPHGKLIFLRVRYRKPCADIGHILLGNNIRTFPLLRAWITPVGIPVTIDHQKRMAGLVPDYAENAVPARWIASGAIPAEVMRTAPLVRTDFLWNSLTGKRVPLPGYAFGDGPGHTENVIVEPGLSNALLGAPFFAHRVVMIDIPDEQVAFRDDETQTLPARQHIYAHLSVSTHVGISNRTGQIN